MEIREPKDQSSRMKLLCGFMAVSLLFLLSGLSSLIYQVIWTRMLVFVFGSTTFATSTVLAVFMGGLALGSFAAGRFADRTSKPFIWYGVLEGVIGLWALAAPALFAAAIPLYKLLFEPLHSNSILFGLLRFAVACVILLLPTACMGATLPLLSRFVTRNLNEVGDRVGSLYAVNTLGAVLGALLAGFVLLPGIGMQLTIIVAASTNFFLTASVFLLSQIKGFMQPEVQLAGGSAPASNCEPVPAQPQKSAGGLPSVVLVTMVSIGISGGLAMTYEVAWTRSLLMVIGSTTYAFTLMLSTFLIGIFLGSYLCSRFVDRLKTPVAWFGIAEMVLCLAGFFSIFMFNYLPYFNVVVGSRYVGSPEMSMLFRFLGAGIIMIPISLSLGFVFPLAVKICARDLERLGTSIGQVYAANTVGAIIGAFLSGFFVIPILGLEPSLIWCSTANLFLGLALLMLYGKIRPVVKGLCACLLFVLICWLLQAPHYWDPRVMIIAQHERRQLIGKELMNNETVQVPSLSQWENSIRSLINLIYYKDGRVSNVAVTKSQDGRHHSLYTNGHCDASDNEDMENQAMLAVFPLLAHPAARDVCVIGWGSGVTAGYGLQFPIANLVCAEIEPVVMETSRFFHGVNFKPESDKRTVIELSDGRNYLLGTARQFDAIISEPSNPWQSGVCNLFTREYFQVCRQSLKKDGVFTMWSQIGEIPYANLSQVFAALHAVFPTVYVMDAGAGDINAIAFTDNRKLNFNQLKEGLKNEKVANSLVRFKLQSAEDFIAGILMAPDGIYKSTLGVSPNSDDSNKLEYEVARTYENRFCRPANREWMEKNRGDIKDSIDWGAITDDEKASEFVKIARSAVLRGRAGYALSWCADSLKMKMNADALALTAEINILQHNNDQAAKIVQQGENLFKNDERFVGLAGVIALRKGDYLQARQSFEKALEIKPSNCNFCYFLALCYSPLDCQELDGLYVVPPSIEPARVVALCKAPSENRKFVDDKPAILLLLADAYKRLDRFADADATARRLLEIAPNDVLTWRLLAENYGAQKLRERSAYCWSKFYNLSSQEAPAALSKIEQLLREKRDLEAVRQIQRLLEKSPTNEKALALLKELASRNDPARKFLSSLLPEQAAGAVPERNR